MKRRSIIVIVLFAVSWMRSSGVQPFPGPASVTDTVTPASWSLVIEANVAGAHDSLASLGVRPDATPDYDPQYEVPRPPAPPGAYVQVYFPHDGGNWPTLLGNRFAVDLTDPQAPQWRIEVETNAGNGPLTLSWEPAAIAALPGSYFLTMRDSAADSLVNLRETGSYTFGYTEPRTFLLEVEFASTFIETGIGWNIISLPRLVPDRSVDALFPSRSSAAFGFDDAYTTSDSLDAGRGYWLKFPSPTVTVLTGIGIDSIDIPLQEGWNLVGTIAATIATPSQPGLATPFYEYDAGYRRADSLVPGRGYWVKASSPMTLSIGPSAMASRAGMITDPSGAAASLTIRSGQGAAMTLHILRDDAAGRTPAFDLPPVPPAPAFDARFVRGGVAAALPAGGATGALDIAVQGEGGLVAIAADRGSLPSDLEVFTGPDQWEAITGISEPVALSLGPGRNIIRVRLKPAAEAPAAFRIEGNYPNPFNPATVIAYELPEASFVTLTVIDPAGRSVHRGLPVRVDAGRREYRFDAGAPGLAGGAYFFVLDAEPVAGGRSSRASGKFLFLK